MRRWQRVSATVLGSMLGVLAFFVGMAVLFMGVPVVLGVMLAVPLALLRLVRAWLVGG